MIFQAVMRRFCALKFQNFYGKKPVAIRVSWSDCAVFCFFYNKRICRVVHIPIESEYVAADGMLDGYLCGNILTQLVRLYRLRVSQLVVVLPIQTLTSITYECLLTGDPHRERAAVLALAATQTTHPSAYHILLTQQANQAFAVPKTLLHSIQASLAGTDLAKVPTRVLTQSSSTHCLP